MIVSISECKNCKSSPYVDHACAKDMYIIGCPHLGCQDSIEKKTFYHALREWNYVNHKRFQADSVSCVAEIGSSE